MFQSLRRYNKADLIAATAHNHQVNLDMGRRKSAAGGVNSKPTVIDHHQARANDTSVTSTFIEHEEDNDEERGAVDGQSASSTTPEPNAEADEHRPISLSQMKTMLVDWIRKPYQSTAENSHVLLARSIDHISKTAFTLLFGLFSFFYFLTYAFIKPAQLEDWIEKEFEAVD